MPPGKRKSTINAFGVLLLLGVAAAIVLGAIALSRSSGHEVVVNVTPPIPVPAPAPASSPPGVSAAHDSAVAEHCPHPFSPYDRYGGPASAKDISTDTSVAEFELVAESAFIDILGDGRAVEFMTFNSELPGPQLNVRLGQRVVVHFYNHLLVNLSIHWHGVETPATSDGSLISQLPVQPSGYFRYEFVPHTSGLTWYHPHHDTRQTVHRGLYGTMLVRSPHEDVLLGTLPNSGGVMVLSDLNLANTSSHPIKTMWPADPVERAEWGLNGLEGNVLLSNGKPNGEHTIWRRGSDGFPLRLRIVNVANARIMRVFVPGMRMWRVGGDQGLISHPIEIHAVPMSGGGHGMSGGMGGMEGMGGGPGADTGLIITPGERADIVLVPNEHSRNVSEFRVMWYDMAKGLHAATQNPDGSLSVSHAHNDGQRRARMLAKIKLCEPTQPARGYDWTPPATLVPATPIDPGKVESTIVVTFGHMPPVNSGVVTFFAFRVGTMPKPFPMLTATDAPRVNASSVHRIRVINLTGMTHNIHLHGFRFQWTVSRTYYADSTVATTHPHGGEVHEDKDTIIVHKRPGAAGVSRTESDYLVDFSPGLRSTAEIAAAGKHPTTTTSGGWLFHCHILEHADLGMMGFIQVV